MTGRPARHQGLSAAETADWQECQRDHDGLMAQLADREALIEAGLIDSYSEYTFTWGRPPRTAPGPPGSQPAARPRGTAEARAWDPPF
ncbi:hypothetical protein [Streptomyces sp. NPDC048269]|uniref:hypothetical protein n=1 Tax=Streptomyces sp. NPDC048269 TaxID=3155753 RepID=UPI0034150753